MGTITKCMDFDGTVTKRKNPISSFVGLLSDKTKSQKNKASKKENSYQTEDGFSMDMLEEIVSR